MLTAGHSSQMIELTVYGLPAPQGSKRHVGRGIMIESSKNVKPWREAVKYAALELREDGPHGAALPRPMSGPLYVAMIFTLPKPKSAPKSRTIYPDRKPDLSKLIRSTEDALTDAGVWEDDARVVEVVAAKRYPGEGKDALRTPGAVIRISPHGAWEAAR